MPLQIECPGCKATLHVPDELAGKQGKCIHCGHRLTVPGGRASVSGIMAGGGAPSGLFEATPESMVRELFRRQQSAVLLIFPTPADGSYDLANIADTDLKCIATEDINQARFLQLVASFAQRYGPRKKGPGSSVTLSADEMLYELKGDKLGMTLEEFKQKYERSGEGGTRLPLCSDTAWGTNKASLRSEPWHQRAGIVHARIDLPTEDNSPTVAGVKTELMLYEFVDGKLFRIAAWLPTDKFHLISEAAISKYGPVSRETQKPRQLIWENAMAWVALTRGTVHPPEASVIELVHRQLHQVAESRVPTGASDI
jgi:ribosomal protein S27E